MSDRNVSSHHVVGAGYPNPSVVVAAHAIRVNHVPRAGDPNAGIRAAAAVVGAMVLYKFAVSPCLDSVAAVGTGGAIIHCATVVD